MTAKPRKSPPPAPSRRPPWLWIVVGAVVLVAAIIAVVSAGGGDGGDDKGDGSGTAAAGQETRPVTITGTPLAPHGAADPDPAVGARIPTVAGASFDGTPMTISADGRGKLVLFVAHWCPHCQKEVPLLADFMADSPLPADVDLVTVSTSVSAARPNYPPSAWLQREHWEAPVLVDSKDSEAAQAIGLTGQPYFVAVDASGVVRARTSGEITTDQFRQLVGLARSGQ
jgi:thiol-disulfide isomerase/thioredoxin